MKKNNDFDFNWNDNSSSDGFSDIFSDTSAKKRRSKNDSFDLMSGDIYSSSQKNPRKGKKGKKTAKIIISIVLVLAIICGAGYWWFKSNFDYKYNNITENSDELGFEEIIDKKIVNIALFGIDTREVSSFKGLSDSIMILSLNTETKVVKIISVMRDSLVAIEKDGVTSYNKINSAYSRGGPELAIRTLNKNFGLDISEYATVNFFGMAEIIDAVGGIDVELTQREVTASGNNNHGINDMIQEMCASLGKDPTDYYVRESGKLHLNGIQAVAYSRIRYVANIWGTNNDYGRTDRQRYVMEQLFNSVLTLSKSKYIALAKALTPYTETSLDLKEILGLALSIFMHSPQFQQNRMPQNDYCMRAPSIRGVGSCVYYDLDFASKLIHSFIYDNITFDDYVAQNGISKNDWYSQR